MKKLSDENAKLIAATRKYCSTERANFLKGQAQVNNEIKLFKEVRAYFIKHYKRVSNYLRSKYNH